MANENAPAGRDVSLALSAAGVGVGEGSEQSSSDGASPSTEDETSSNTISVNIKLLGGNDFVMDVHRDITVSALKTRVRQRTDVEEVSPKTKRSCVWYRMYHGAVLIIVFSVASAG